MTERPENIQIRQLYKHDPLTDVIAGELLCCHLICQELSGFCYKNSQKSGHNAIIHDWHKCEGNLYTNHVFAQSAIHLLKEMNLCVLPHHR